MSLVSPYGNPKASIWVIMHSPCPRDTESGIILSSGLGFMFKKTWALANASNDFYACALCPCIGASYDENVRFSNLIDEINIHKPSLLVVLGDDMLNMFVPETKQRNEKASSLIKWAGSLLKCKFITHDHYVIGTYPPDFLSSNWDMHEIMGYIDLGHVAEEIKYYNENQCLKPLPNRTLITSPTYETIIDYLRYILDSYSTSKLAFVSSDIETIRPKKSSFYNVLKHPGYTYTISLAPSSKEGISFCLWDYPIEHAIKIWRLLGRVLAEVPQCGQNYFSFDSHHLEALGFNICLDKCYDTMIGHHILWPRLPHKLQFQTRQYTREPYYKDEGKNWSARFKNQLLKYNALDSTVTFEIMEAQQLEFQERPHLK